MYLFSFKETVICVFMRNENVYLKHDIRDLQEKDTIKSNICISCDESIN